MAKATLKASPVAVKASPAVTAAPVVKKPAVGRPVATNHAKSKPPAKVAVKKTSAKAKDKKHAQAKKAALKQTKPKTQPKPHAAVATTVQ